MKFLPAPYGYDAVGEVVHVCLSATCRIDRKEVTAALLAHSCYPSVIPRILDCLEQSVYQCWMRPQVACEVLQRGFLATAGIRFEVLSAHHRPSRSFTMDTFNKFAVGLVGMDVAIMMPPRRLAPGDAMEFAAWLVTMAQIQDKNLPPFVAYINAVQSS